MAKLILRQEAIDDLNDIWEYTVIKWSENQANTYYGMIKTACKEIAKNSVTGRNYRKINSNLLGYKVGKHIIFYQMILDGKIEVIRILHERMDLKNKLSE